MYTNKTMYDKYIECRQNTNEISDISQIRINESLSINPFIGSSRILTTPDHVSPFNYKAHNFSSIKYSIDRWQT